MKLQKKNNKLLAIAGIVIAAVVLLAIIATILFFVLTSDMSDNTEKNPTDIVEITLSSFPENTVYFVGEEFNPEGTIVQILTFDPEYTDFIDHTKLSFSGFDSSNPVEEQVITVSYKGFTTTFTVTIKEMPKDSPTVETIEIFDFKTTITMSDWNEFGPISLIRGSTLKIVYSDGTMGDSVYVDPAWVWGYEKVSQPGTFDLTIKYNNDGTLYEKVVTITITN